YSVTIKRGAFLFKEKEYVKELLGVLREYRNQAIHANVTTEEIESYLYHLKNIVESLFYFHFAKKFQFASLQEAASFLDLPADIDMLKERIDLMKNALKYRGYK